MLQRANISLNESLTGLSDAKKRPAILAKHLRAAADAIEKGEGVIDFSISMGGIWDGRREDPYTHVGWTSAAEVRRQKRRAKNRHSLAEASPA